MQYHRDAHPRARCAPVGPLVTARGFRCNLTVCAKSLRQQLAAVLEHDNRGCPTGGYQNCSRNSRSIGQERGSLFNIRRESRTCLFSRERWQRLPRPPEGATPPSALNRPIASLVSSPYRLIAFHWKVPAGEARRLPVDIVRTFDQAIIAMTTNDRPDR